MAMAEINDKPLGFLGWFVIFFGTLVAVVGFAFGIGPASYPDPIRGYFFTGVVVLLWLLVVRCGWRLRKGERKAFKWSQALIIMAIVAMVSLDMGLNFSLYGLRPLTVIVVVPCALWLLLSFRKKINGKASIVQNPD